jgi:hypothetical protein
MKTIGVRSLLAAVLATACTPARASQPLSEHLQPFAFLEGSCWRGTFAGRSVTDEHCFQGIFGGRFLRDRHVVRGDSVPYEGETTYAWDPQHGQVVYWYIALPGFHSTGHVEFPDSSIVFRDTVVSASGRRELRSTWRRSGVDSYTIRVEERTANATNELWSMEMRRFRKAGT